MKKSIVLGSVCSAILLVLLSLPSVASFQDMTPARESTIKTYIDRFNIELPEQPWQPGTFILLFMAVMQAVSQAIGQGQWFPGLVSGAILFYFILVWLVIFAGQDVEIPS